MYGLEPDLDLSFLVDCELIQVAVGENEVILNFTSDVSITVAGGIRIDHGDVIDDSRAAGAALLGLLGGVIEDATGTTDGTLTMRWRNAQRLTILDSWSDYESYTISSPGGTIVV